jgi:hypothetical protein
VPLQKLVGKKIPADGADVCQPVFGDALSALPPEAPAAAKK